MVTLPPWQSASPCERGASETMASVAGRSLRLVASRGEQAAARIIIPAYLPQTAVSYLSPIVGSNAPCSGCSRKTLLTLGAPAALAFLRYGVVFELRFAGFTRPSYTPFFLSTTNTTAPQQRCPRKHHLQGCHKRQRGYLICLYCDLCSTS